ncbi:hypothetical protein ACFLIM_39445 [Nonomuraea sp. M3C6]|uniref:Uncharacterized protein n=1 Tax=Nonomuraea marmarensis TaxID=3351344 RepID=A0ABW7APH9_9ACTN
MLGLVLNCATAPGTIRELRDPDAAEDADENMTRQRRSRAFI